MATYTGVLNILTEYNPKYRNAGAKIQGMDEWFRLNEEQAASVSKGDKVTVIYSPDGKGGFRVKAIEQAAEVGGGSRGRKSGGGGYSGGGNDARSDAIQYQHSQEMALRAVNILVTSESFKLPAKPADRYDAVLGLVDALTAKFHNDIATLAAVKAEKGVQEDLDDDEDEEPAPRKPAKKKKKAAPPPDDEDEGDDNDGPEWDED